MEENVVNKTKFEDLDYKAKSRQVQIWMSIFTLFATLVGSYLMIWYGKDISSANGIVSTISVALAGITGTNYLSKPETY